MAQRTKPRDTGFGWETPYDIYVILFDALPKKNAALFFNQQQDPHGNVSYHFEYHFVPAPATDTTPHQRATLDIPHFDFIARSAQSIADEFLAKIRGTHFIPKPQPGPQPAGNPQAHPNPDSA